MEKQKNNKSADGSYYDGKFETIEYIEYVVGKLVENGIEPKRAFCVGQALKYLSSRLGQKRTLLLSSTCRKLKTTFTALCGESGLTRNT